MTCHIVLRKKRVKHSEKKSQLQKKKESSVSLPTIHFTGAMYVMDLPGLRTSPPPSVSYVTLVDAVATFGEASFGWGWWLKENAWD